MANAGLFGGQGPVAYVNNLYAPQQAQLAQQQQARTATLQALVGSILNHLSSPQPDAAGAAIQDQTGAANAAAGTLTGLNPNDATQAMLRAIGAPGSQQQQVAGQNQATFGGGASLLQGVGGAIPAGVFAQDAAARQGYLNSLPAIVGQSAIMGLGRLNQLASNENTTLATDKAKSLMQARDELAKFVQTNQKNAFNRAATTARLNQGQQRLDLTSQMDAFNQKYKIANLNLASQKFAQMTLNQDRSYGLQLKRLGLQTKSLQLRAIRDEYKLKSGGFTPIELNKFKTSAYNIAQNAFNGFTDKKGNKFPAVTYQQAIKEMRSSGVPLSLAIPALREAGYAPGVRGTPLAANASAFGLADVNAEAGNAFGNVASFAGQTGQKIGSIVSGAKARGLDPGAVLAVASQEGLGGGVGDSGTSFGPFQLHAGGALPAAVWARGPEFAHQWAWSPAGLNYALDRIAGVARGLTGTQAINAIVRSFERPAKPDAEVAGAVSAYGG